MRRFSLFCLLVGFCLAVWLITAEALVHDDYRTSPTAAEHPSQLVVTPLLLWAQLPVGEQEVQNLYVGNAGLTATLNYTISVLPFAQITGIVDWLEVEPRTGTIPTDSQVIVDVTIVPQPYMPVGSLHSASLRVDSDSLVTPTVITVPVLLEVVEPVVEPVVVPPALSADLPIGDTKWQTLTLGNEGNATMVFTLTLPAEPSLRGVPWLAVSPPTGTVPPGQGQVVTATFDAGGLLPSVYTTHLIVESNSSLQPELSVPVTLTVRSAPPFVGPIHDGPELDYQPAIIRVQPGGRLMVVFERIDLPSFLGDLYVTFSDDGGRSWTTPRAIIDSPGNERHPALVQVAPDSFILFYLVDEMGSGAYRIHRATSPDGSTWIDQGAIDLGWVMPGEINPSVIREADGTLAMTYHRLSGPSYIARSTDGGVTWDTFKTQVSDGNAQLPRLAKRESDGLYLVTYQVGGSDLDVYAKLSTDPYDWHGPEIPLSTAINSHDSQPIVLEDGAFLAFFARQVGSVFDIFYRLSCDGITWSDEVQVTTDNLHYDTQPHPLLHGTPGHVLLTWSHQKSAAPYEDHDVWIDNDLQIRPELCTASKTVDPPAFVPVLDLLTYTLTLPNNGLTTTAWLNDPIPADAAYEPGSLWASSGDYGYDSVAEAITWTGVISSGDRVSLGFQVSAALDVGDGDALTNTALLVDGQGLSYALAARALGDTLPPASAILDPQAGRFISSTAYLVGGMATDTASGVSSVAVSVDGGLWQPALGAESWAFQWDDLTEGEHSLRSQATDRVGHVEAAGPGITVTVDTTAPGVVAVVPASEAVDVPLDTAIEIRFSEIVRAWDFEIAPDPGGWVIAATKPITHVFLFHSDFDASQTYSCTVRAQDRALNWQAPFHWSFTTQPRYRIHLPLVLRSFLDGLTFDE